MDSITVYAGFVQLDLGRQDHVYVAGRGPLFTRQLAKFMQSAPRLSNWIRYHLMQLSMPQN